MSLLLGGGQIAIANHNTCRLYVMPPADADATEANIGEVTSAVSFWPLGDVCDWPRVDGKPGTVQLRQGSYSGTIFTYALTVGGIASGTVALALVWRRRRDRRPATNSTLTPADQDLPRPQK
jgi:hypothetical protein